MNKTVESLSRRIEMKDAALKSQRAETDTIQEELEAKLVKQVIEHSQLSAEFKQLSAEFKSLKKQHLELAELHDETSKALNAKTHQLETMSQDLVAAHQELETKQHMVTELRRELAAAQAQVKCCSNVKELSRCMIKSFNFCALKILSFVLEV